MGWEYSYRADIGLYRDLMDAVITGVDPYELNNAMTYYATAREQPIIVDPYSGVVEITDIPEGTFKTLFGFALKQNGVFNHKYVICRAYGLTVHNTSGDVRRRYDIRWSIYDGQAETYTDITYPVQVGLNPIGQLYWNSISVYVGFRYVRQWYHGVEQHVIYGGLFAYSSDSNPSGFVYYSLGMQGIGTVYHLSAYDEIELSGVPISPEYGPAAEEGGYGPTPSGGSSGGSGGPAPTFDSVSDPWTPTPTKPGVLNYGLLNMYKCDNGSLNNLGDALFPEIPTFPTPPQPSQGASLDDIVKWCGDVAEWAVNCANAFFESVWNKGLIDYIVSLHLLPIDVTGGALEDIKVGPRTMTGILARPVSADVVEFDCGTIHVDEYYTNYVDYMTRCRVYIPYYGMVTIKPEYWQSANIQLKYIWNVMDGSFIAQLFSTINRHQKPCTVMIGQYSGCACVHMPLSGVNYANMFSQLTGAAGGMAAGIASGNVAVTANSAMALAGAAGNTGDMQQSNAYNASSAFYGHARAYLTIERPVSHFSIGYASEQGLPLFVTKTIGQCSGLTICENPVLNFACPGDEAKAIISALKEGVIL